MEGTILTVSRESAEEWLRYLRRNPETDIPYAWKYLRNAAERSLRAIPLLLEDLEEAQVVDAGAKGFCLILEGMEPAFSGRKLFQDSWDDRTGIGAYVFMEQNVMGKQAAKGVLTYRAAFSIRLRDYKCGAESLDDLEDVWKKRLETFGEQAVLLRTEEAIRCQVFTDRPKELLKACLESGALLNFLALVHGAVRKAFFYEPLLPSDQILAETYEKPRYCTEFSVLKDALDRELAPEMEKRLLLMGDSVAAAEGEDMVKCHIHTDTPLLALPDDLAGGYLTEIKLERLP